MANEKLWELLRQWRAEIYRLGEDGGNPDIEEWLTLVIDELEAVLREMEKEATDNRET